MSGGEPTNLHEVLDAKEALALRPTTYAYEVVLRDLKTRQAEGPQERTQALIKHAIEALEALERADVAQASTAPGNPRRVPTRRSPKRQKLKSWTPDFLSPSQ